MATKQIRIGEDFIAILDKWRHEHESLSDAVRRMDRHPRKHGEDGVE